MALCLAMTFAFCANVFAAEINVDEKRILDKLNKEPFASKLDKRYVNQFENYFSMDHVNIEKESADAFLKYFEKAINGFKTVNSATSIFNQSPQSFEAFQKAGESIGLYLEYDSNINDYYAVDTNGYVIIDSQKVIKDTGDDSNSNKKKTTGKTWNISVEIIFACVLLMIFLGFVINTKKWVKKIRKHSEKNYDDEEDEMEVANRKTRRARLQTFSYTNFKQVVKYFYVPVIMCIVVVAVLFVLFKPYTSLINSIKDGFVQTLTINTYSEGNKKYNDTPLVKTPTISGDQVKWPRFTEPYGVIKCDKIKLDAPLYMGDSDYVLSGKIKDKVENDYGDDFEKEVNDEFKGAAGTYLGSSIPGDGKTILVGAHDTTFFKPLEHVKKGLVMDVTTSYARYKYKVKDIKIFNEDETDKAYDFGAKKERLILYTCYPFGKLKGDKSKRMFVYLDKTFGPSIDKEVKK